MGEFTSSHIDCCVHCNAGRRAIASALVRMALRLTRMGSESVPRHDLPVMFAAERKMNFRSLTVGLTSSIRRARSEQRFIRSC